MTKKRRIIPSSTTELRFKWFTHLGGLSTVSVRNKEWMTLLQEDTRNSLMIEGYFVSRVDIADIIQNSKYSKEQQKVLGYFDAAFMSYELAFQQYKTHEFKMTKSIIRQIHSLMFRGDPHFAYTPGDWRKGDIQITGALIKPSHSFTIEQDIEKLIEVINAPTDNLIRKLAVSHDMFEQIHPFPDGNGRVGRILMNFILVANGFPNIAINGLAKERARYIEALEQADPIISLIMKNNCNDAFSKPIIILEDIISKSLATALDVIVCNRYQEKKPLLLLSEVATITGKSLATLRVACSQKKLICSKIIGHMKTHPDLFVTP